MNKLEKEQGVVVSGYTGYLCCKFSDLHAEIEKRLGRPVFTHELGDKQTYETIRQAFKEDFLKICSD